MTTARWTSMPSPIGPLLLAADAQGQLTGVFMDVRAHDRGTVQPGWVRDDDAFSAARRQLDEYFAGTRTTFGLALNPAGTPFQRLVWDALRAIPYGEVRSYGAIAEQIGRPGAARAVGLANGSNPIAVIVPCHRVIGASGALTGYGGGLPRKQFLLDLEARVVSGQAALYA
jgi:methylated-DNA-[protein]-cysteine S-methyltransferase